MKDIQAIGAILAFWRIVPSAPATASRAFLPVRKSERRAESCYDGGTNTPSGRVNLQQSRVGIPNLLAAALLQGGSSTERRRN
jgi:hypothetical protein